MSAHDRALQDQSKSITPRPQRKAVFKWVRRIYILLGLTALAGMFAGYQASGFDETVLRSDDSVTVRQEGDLLTFAPKRPMSSTALLFFPGAMVEPSAYAPLARSIAKHGYQVTILSLPLRLAPTEASAANVLERAFTVMSSDASIRHWVIAGHSKGGKLAARFAHSHAHFLSGLVLIGTSHPNKEFDLSKSPVDVTKIYATGDGLASPEEVAANSRFLPPQTHWMRIEGGNHTQFGYYRFQLGDGTATIDRSSQQQFVLEAILRSLERAGNAASVKP